MSEDKIELGTLQNPYKNIDSVLIELFNTGLGEDRNVTIRLMKDSEFEISILNSVVYGISNLKFEPYDQYDHTGEDLFRKYSFIIVA